MSEFNKEFFDNHHGFKKGNIPLPVRVRKCADALLLALEKEKA